MPGSDRTPRMTPRGRTHPMALKNNTIAGYDKKSVWAQIFGRDRAGELLKIMLDEEEATYQRLMELARRVRPPAVDHAIA